MERSFSPGQDLPSTWPNAAGGLLSGFASNFTVRISASDPTRLEVPAGTSNSNDATGGQPSIAVGSKWRWNTATVSSAGPGGGTARPLDVYVTASDNVFTPGTPGEVDNTVRTFGLAIVESGALPSGVTFFRKVATAQWDGARFYAVEMMPGLGALPRPSGPVHAWLSTAVSVFTDGTWTKVALDSIDFDAQSWFQTANRRFLPTLVGFYRISACVGFLDAPSAGTPVNTALYKNGVLHRHLSGAMVSPSSAVTVPGSSIVQSSGADYFELYVSAVDPGFSTRRLRAGASETYLDAEYLGYR